MHFIYLEAGSGAKQSVSSKMVSVITHNVNIPVIVGGGIREHINAKSIARAGADAIVTGTIVETEKSGKTVRKIIEGIREVKKHDA